MGHRVNRHIVLVFVSFLLAGLVLTASAQMASAPSSQVPVRGRLG
jgi:hypothetical protein